MGSIAALELSIGQNKLPYLSELYLFNCTLRSEDFRVLVDGLVAAPNGLRVLRFDEVRISGSDIQHLANALLVGGSLGRLETLVLGDVKRLQRGNFDPILQALVGGGAPCAHSLTTLSLHYSSFTKAGMRSFFLELGSGGLPFLVDLDLAHLGQSGEKIDNDSMHDLVDAFLALAAAKTPTQLKTLTLGDGMTLTACMHELGRAFEANSLPRLTTLHLVIGRPNATSKHVSKWFDLWKQLGPIIHSGRFGMWTEMREALHPCLLEALADPAFLPSLQASPNLPYINHVDVECSLEERRQKQEAKAAGNAAAGAGGGSAGRALKGSARSRKKARRAAVTGAGPATSTAGRTGERPARAATVVEEQKERSVIEILSDGEASGAGIDEKAGFVDADVLLLEPEGERGAQEEEQQQTEQHHEEEGDGQPASSSAAATAAQAVAAPQGAGPSAVETELRAQIAGLEAQVKELMAWRAQQQQGDGR